MESCSATSTRPPNLFFEAPPKTHYLKVAGISRWRRWNPWSNNLHRPQLASKYSHYWWSIILCGGPNNCHIDRRLWFWKAGNALVGNGISALLSSTLPRCRSAGYCRAIGRIVFSCFLIYSIGFRVIAVTLNWMSLSFGLYFDSYFR